MNRLERQAMTALDAMVIGNHTATDYALNQLHTEHGDAGITTALMVWCDAALAAMPSGSGPVQLLWKDTHTGRVHTTADNVPVAEQWAGRLLAARAADDRDLFIALAQAVPADKVPEHVGAMVQMAACIIQEATP